MKAADPSAAQILSRVLVGLAGVYAFVWGFATLGITLLVVSGMGYEEAWKLVMLLAFLVFLGLFCWTFAAASLTRVWIVLLGGGGTMTLAGWLLLRHLS